MATLCSLLEKTSVHGAAFSENMLCEALGEIFGRFQRVYQDVTLLMPSN